MPEPRTNHGLAESTYRQAKHMQAAGTTPQLMGMRLFIPVAVATAILAEPVNSDLGGIERLATNLDICLHCGADWSTFDWDDDTEPPCDCDLGPTYGPGWPD